MQKIEPPRLEDVALLAGKFRDDIAALNAAIADERLPLQVFETLRSVDRQDFYFRTGVSRASGAAGPHCWGLAVDFILIPKHQHWATVKEWPEKNGGGAAWDTGVVFDGRACQVRRPKVAAVWQRYGAIAHGLGLTWGGHNAGAWASPHPGDLFGWDIAHVQAREWRKLITGHKSPASFVQAMSASGA